MVDACPPQTRQARLRKGVIRLERDPVDIRQSDLRFAALSEHGPHLRLILAVRRRHRLLLLRWRVLEPVRTYSVVVVLGRRVGASQGLSARRGDVVAVRVESTETEDLWSLYLGRCTCRWEQMKFFGWLQLYQTSV